MNYAIILSGGTGGRVKEIEIPKQYYMVKGRPVFYYSLKTIAEASFIDKFMVVAADEWKEFILEYSQDFLGKFLGFAIPGENRQLSIYNALLELEKIAEEDDIILIHDAARPMVSASLLKNCILETQESDGAMPVLPMKDTIYFSANSRIVDSLLERDHVFAGQAPEAFKYGKYLKANQQLMPDKILKINGSSEAAIKMGMNILLFQGEEKNFKITTYEDLKRFMQIMDGED